MGHKKHNHKESISTETLKKIAERKEKKTALNNGHTRAEKVNAQEAYANVNRSMKKIIKANKSNDIEMFTAEAEEAVLHWNMRDLYTTTKKLSRKFSKLERPVKNKNGRAIPGVEGQKNRWMEHFQELLNRPTP